MKMRKLWTVSAVFVASLVIPQYAKAIDSELSQRLTTLPTEADCRKALEIVRQRLLEVSLFDGIVRHKEGRRAGEIHHMRQQEAVQYCKKHGGHLPDARELALLFESLGAAGILETRWPRIPVSKEVAID